MRTASVERTTKETAITVEVNLDGQGAYDVATGIGFLDHMLEQLSRHSLIDLKVRASGDLHIDFHHTTEDTGIVIGTAVARALGDRAGITRYGQALIPMDETLTRVALDVSNRPYLIWRVRFTRPKLGDMDTELFKEWFQAFTQAAGVTLHIETLYGENSHHIVESCLRGWPGRSARRSRSIPGKGRPCRRPKARSRPVAEAADRAGTMNVAIVDYGSGNLRSAAKAFERAARERGGQATVTVTAEAEAVARADRIVLPGVGAFGDCARSLAAVPGMTEALAEAVRDRGRPFLGICVGMQLMATRGLEHGRHPGFDWIPGDVVPLEIDDPSTKIPHMGWNDLEMRRDHPVLAGIAAGEHAYFVHSFALRPDDPADVLAEVEYGGAVVAAVGRDNLVGTQFHPEKSQATGLRLIANFLSWSP